MKPDHADEIIAQWRSELPEIAGLPLEIAKRTARLGAILDGAAERELQRLRLTKAEYQILATLRRVGAPFQLRPTELTASLRLSSGGTSNALKRMTAAGLVQRCEDANDGRSSWVKLTPAGLKTAELAVRSAVSAHERLLAQIPRQTRKRLNSLLREVLLALGDKPAGESGLPTPAGRTRAKRRSTA